MQSLAQIIRLTSAEVRGSRRQKRKALKGYIMLCCIYLESLPRCSLVFKQDTVIKGLFGCCSHTVTQLWSLNKVLAKKRREKSPD